MPVWGVLNSFQKALAYNYHVDWNETCTRVLSFPEQLVLENAQAWAWCCPMNIGFIYNLPYGASVGRASG